METYEIHNREVLLKSMETCARECCKDDCPYYGKTGNGTSCRARLLMDAMAALTKDKDDLDEMEAAARTFREERDKLNQAITAVAQHRDELAADKDMLREENKSLRNERDILNDEITKLTEKLEAAEDKTDRPSARDKELMEEVGKLIGQAKYQEGRADALAEIVERCSFGGGGRHE